VSGAAVSVLPQWESCVSEFLREGFGPGAVVPHEWFYAKLNLSKSGPRTPLEQAQRTQFLYWDEMDKVRQVLLEEHCIAINSRPGVGYEVVPPGEQSGWATKHMTRQFGKEFRLCRDRIVYTNVDALTDGERKDRSDQLAKLAQLQTMTKRSWRLKP
jgi:hypothetical protein